MPSTHAAEVERLRNEVSQLRRELYGIYARLDDVAIYLGRLEENMKEGSDE